MHKERALRQSGLKHGEGGFNSKTRIEHKNKATDKQEESQIKVRQALILKPGQDIKTKR